MPKSKQEKDILIYERVIEELLPWAEKNLFIDWKLLGFFQKSSMHITYFTDNDIFKHSVCDSYLFSMDCCQ